MNKSRMTIVCLILVAVFILCGFTVGSSASTTPTVNHQNIAEAATIIPTTESITETITETVKEKDTKSKKIEVEETESLTDEEVILDEETEEKNIYSDYIYSPSDFQSMGVIDWGGWTWTYYSENILPGEGLYIPGRYTDNNGYVCDENGYICLASSSLSWGTIVDTPFGKAGKVYDCGCAEYILDVYTNW